MANPSSHDASAKQDACADICPWIIVVITASLSSKKKHDYMILERSVERDQWFPESLERLVALCPTGNRL